MQPLLILLYHHCNSKSYIEKRPDKKLFVEDDEFSMQIQWLKENFLITDLDDAYFSPTKKDMTKPGIIITFDDGHRDNYEFAYNISKKLDVPITIYLTSSWIELPSLQWRAEIAELVQLRDSIRLINDESKEFTLLKSTKDGSDIYSYIAAQLVKLTPNQREELIEKIVTLNGRSIKDRQQEFLTWQQVREMRTSGLVSIGAHTCTHPMLSTLGETEVFRELDESKKTIERHLNEEVRHFAYPYGGSNAALHREFNLAKKVGYCTATTTIAPTQMPKGYKQTNFSLCRLSVDGRWNLTEFQNRILSEVKFLCV